MLDTIYFLVVALTGAYFMALSVVAIVAPSRASAFLMGFASSMTAHYAELLVRAAVGLAFISQAADAPFPASFTVFGWLLVATSFALFLVPWRWHRSFAQRTIPQALRHLRLVALASFFAGGFVLWSLIAAANHV